MERTRFLVAYDIADDRRLRLVHRCVQGYGSRVQYSVFVCDLSPQELIALRTDLREIVHHREDSIMFVDVGATNERGRFCFQFMGQPVQLPSPGGPKIV